MLITDINIPSGLIQIPAVDIFPISKSFLLVNKHGALAELEPNFEGVGEGERKIRQVLNIAYQNSKELIYMNMPRTFCQNANTAKCQTLPKFTDDSELFIKSSHLV